MTSGTPVRVNMSMVVPRFGQIAAQLTRNGYSVLPLAFGRKKPLPFDWRNYRFKPGDEQQYSHAGIGLICGDLIAVDIDVYDESTARKLAALARDSLGIAPTRVGRAPKVALLYRNAGPTYPKLYTSAYRFPADGTEDKPHRVEVLASGQQVVAFNLHPVTHKPYKWEPLRDPLRIPFSKLIAVTQSQIEEFIRGADAILRESGTPVGSLAQAEANQYLPPGESRADDARELARAMEYVPNSDESYDDWIRICYAIKGALGSDGFPVFERWSARSKKHDPATTRAAWEGAKPTRIGAGTIFFHAERNGWKRAPVSPRLERGSWPLALDECALTGLFGDIVRAIEPDTESDPVAILMQAVVAFGSLLGRGPYYLVEGDKHYANLFLVLVGPTAKARKGTSWGRVRDLFARVHGWPRVVNGLSSGEGLISAVNDVDMQGFQGIAAVANDKRLLVMEPEFAQVLRQGTRVGNILSATVRSAWDTGNLMTLTKNNPLCATDAHISIVAHITETELRSELTESDSANGFANRFIYQCVRRSKRLPFGGQLIPEVVLLDLAGRVERALEKARQLKSVGMSQEARALWESEYRVLSEGHQGLFGAITARSEAQVIRLALTYALANEAEEIDAGHLRAALAIWKRAEDSARYIFGSALGNSVADDLLRALRAAGADGMTRTAIRDYFARHAKAGQVNAALDLLERQKLAILVQQPSEGGRPPELWVAAEHATEAIKATEVAQPSEGLPSHRSLRSQPRKVRVLKRSNK